MVKKDIRSPSSSDRTRVKINRLIVATNPRDKLEMTSKKNSINSSLKYNLKNTEKGFTAFHR